jgi:hypothetical protein
MNCFSLWLTCATGFNWGLGCNNIDMETKGSEGGGGGNCVATKKQVLSYKNSVSHILEFIDHALLLRVQPAHVHLAIAVLAACRILRTMDVTRQKPKGVWGCKLGT